ncbi:hypothetical protein BLA6992_02548 [Burkholderia lata]|nr:hypothetical protein BLA6992_02548 [Burkholderia lata]
MSINGMPSGGVSNIASRKGVCIVPVYQVLVFSV